MNELVGMPVPGPAVGLSEREDIGRRCCYYFLFRGLGQGLNRVVVSM